MRHRILLALVLPAVFLVTGATSFRRALPGYTYRFPRDHSSHPEYQTEWWYYTGHLKTGAGRRFAYELTFFRVALAPAAEKRGSKWTARDVVFAHLALTDEEARRFYFTDRIERAALGLAGASTGKSLPRVWIDDWALEFSGGRGELQQLKASGQSRGAQPIEFGLTLRQQALKPPVVHGSQGVSQKSAGAGNASHYYSFTRLRTTGELKLASQKFRVEGESWFDHEFGTNQLAPGQVGWDWFSLQLNDGRELMLYRMRLKNGGFDPASSGTLVNRDGTTHHLVASDFTVDTTSSWRSPATGAEYPARWRIDVPAEHLQLQIEPRVNDQELTTAAPINLTYWEGSVDISGTSGNRQIRGQGYVELTGYAQQLSGIL